MITLVDVVNLNPDASCLPSGKWLRCLEGGFDSAIMRMLRGFVDNRRKVNLGLVACAIKDLECYNPEVLGFINDHPETFELVLRPFTHDSPPLRLPDGFRLNVKAGCDLIRTSFRRVSDFYLAPEIMTTGEQIAILASMGVKTVFVHLARYEPQARSRIPHHPFPVHGVLGSRVWCAPFVHEKLERDYLETIHGMRTPKSWSNSLSKRKGTVMIWRDGESSLMLPLALEKECQLLEAESEFGIVRAFLSEVRIQAGASPALPANSFHYYPTHSLKPWLNHMKLYWYVNRVRDLERELTTMPEVQRRLWLLTINSDILSSVEKAPLAIKVAPDVLAFDRAHFLWQGVVKQAGRGRVLLLRSERAGEGEDLLAYLEELHSGRLSAEEVRKTWERSGNPHHLKALARAVGFL